MNFNDHSNLNGLHAFLGASKYHWINYDDEKLVQSFEKYKAAQKGTELHDIAARLIMNGIKLPRQNKTLNMYVNDAIGFKMTPEVVLYYSENCFGTADTISFREKDSLLRIHDYKSGEVPAHIEQLLVYNALFCLEYDISPNDISSELRIYQSNEILHHEPDPKDILDIMAKIKRYDHIIKDLKKKEKF